MIFQGKSRAYIFWSGPELVGSFTTLLFTTDNSRYLILNSYHGPGLHDW